MSESTDSQEQLEKRQKLDSQSPTGPMGLDVLQDPLERQKRFEELNSAIDALHSNIAELKKERSRVGPYPPIKLAKDQQTLTFKCEKMSKYYIVLSSIKQKDNTSYVSIVSGRDPNMINAKITINDRSEIMKIEFRGNDYIVWDEDDESYVHCYYSSRMDNNYEYNVKLDIQ